MSISVVLVPGAPVVVPELSGKAADESDRPVATVVEMLRCAAQGAADTVVVGSDPAGRSVGDVRSSLRRWGVDVPVGPPSAPRVADQDAADAMLIGWWFLDRAGVDLPRSFRGVGRGQPFSPGPGADSLVVVVADGPASLTPRAPVPKDPRGVALDSRLAARLTGGGPIPDPGESVADEVGWWSRPAWAALEGLVGDCPADRTVSWAPFGVGYHGASWVVARSGATAPGVRP